MTKNRRGFWLGMSIALQSMAQFWMVLSVTLLSGIGPAVVLLGGVSLGVWVTPIQALPIPPREILLDPGGRFRYVETSNRAGVRQPFLLLTPNRPRAAVILFAGGGGNIGLAADGRIARESNFLMRSRHLFARAGFYTAVVAPPTDRRNLNGFRGGKAHALDIQGVIAYLRGKSGVPVWLVGTSAGTLSVAHVAVRLGKNRLDGGPDGLVLTSSLFMHSRKRGGSVFDAALERIGVPVLVVHHKQDRCRVTPFDRAGAFLRRLRGASRSELIAIAGGTETGANPCRGMSHHGFIGQEEAVVGRIVDWIEANAP